MIRENQDQRAKIAALKRQIKTLEAPAREKAKIARARAKRNRDKAIDSEDAYQRKPRQLDAEYLSWLRSQMCVACVIEGIHRPEPIEAAHQKHTDKRGPSLGKRPDDASSCPLCSYHHREGPNCCDPAQRKFWDRIGIDVAAFCRDLHAAYRSGSLGEDVIRRHASGARK